jgi:hypothetical protein
MRPHRAKKQNKDRFATYTGAGNTASVVMFKITGTMFCIYHCSSYIK